MLRKVKLGGVWKFAPVARLPGAGARGELYDWSKIVVDGVAVVAPVDAAYHLVFQENGQKRRPGVGSNSRDAKAALLTQTQVLKLRRQGVAADDAPQISERYAERQLQSQGSRVDALVEAWVASPPLKLRDKSVAKYRNALRSFVTYLHAKTRKRYLEELGREDVLGFMGWMVLECGLDRSTAVDKGVIVLAVMKDAGAQIAMAKGDWARTTAREIAVYRPEVLKPLFAAATPRTEVLFRTFLLTGMREQEVGYLAWTDFDAKRSTLRVTKRRRSASTQRRMRSGPSRYRVSW